MAERKCPMTCGQLFQTCRRYPKCLFALLTLAASSLVFYGGFELGKYVEKRDYLAHPPKPQQQYATNVNFGGWLTVEDWMFAGPLGEEVSQGSGKGVCLPPVVQGPLDEPYPSEGIFVQRLIEQHDKEYAIKVFEQHRQTFITNTDLDDCVSLGIKTVRVPFMWMAFADALKPIDDVYGGFDPDSDSAIVPDPYYPKEVSYVTIPRNFLAEFLRNCSSRGLKVILDLHAYPSGAAEGTYNGILPLKSVFWWKNSKIGNTSVKLRDAGTWIVEKFIRWVEGLDAKTRLGVQGISIMNEPGNQLMHELDSKLMLDWLANAGDLFRNSYLPSRGVKFYVNLIQGSIQNFFEVTPHWWVTTFSETERNLWAVFDMHNYLAWRVDCKGHHADVNEDGYSCSAPIEFIEAKIRNCLEPFFQQLTDDYPGLKSSGEFSLGTDSVVGYSCTEPAVLKVFMAQQVDLCRKYNFEPFFWNWKMPYSPKFEPGWSYQSYVGLAPKPPFPCHPAKNKTSDAAARIDSSNAKIRMIS